MIKSNAKTATLPPCQFLTKTRGIQMTRKADELSDLFYFEEVRHTQSMQIIRTISTLPISHEWKNIFSKICTERTWYNLSPLQQEQMINIATVDSSAMKFLMYEHKKKAGLALIEKISVQIATEEDRQKAMLAILDKGARVAKRDIDLLISKVA